MSLNNSPKAGPSRDASHDNLLEEDSTELSDEHAELNGEEAEGLARAGLLDADDDEFASEDDGEHPRVDVKGKGVENLDPRHWDYRPPESRSDGRKSFWRDLDLSIIVAIVSPIGNWLTGGDHIKNLVLIILLIFYLHQLIEVPWQLYQSSLPRKSPRSSPSKSSSADQRLAALARSSLTFQEGFYFLLTIASPLIGALFLRHVISALGAADSLSWFSTTLFVLATSIRPWSHLVSRLQARTRLLHDAIHYPSENSAGRHRVETDRIITKLLTRIEALEADSNDVEARLAKAEALQGVCDDLNEALGAAERSTKRGERKVEAAKNAMNDHVEALDARITLLEQRRQHEVRVSSVLIASFGGFYKQMVEWMHTLLHVPQIIWLLGVVNPSSAERHLSRSGAGDLSSFKLNGNDHAIKSHIHSPDRERTAQHAPRLATILEAGDSDIDSDGTYVSEKLSEIRAPGSPPQLRTLRVRSRGSSGGKTHDRRKMRTCGESVVEGVERVALWPYRAGVRLLAIMFPPALKLWI